jgi:hypothetical protein
MVALPGAMPIERKGVIGFGIYLPDRFPQAVRSNRSMSSDKNAIWKIRNWTRIGSHFRQKEKRRATS